ncbi:MAG: CHASE2 domain-containing protein [Methylocystaceae bacterium]
MEKSAEKPATAEEKRDWKSWLLPLAVIALMVLLSLVGLFNRPDMMVYDAWFRLHGPQDPGSKVVVVAMDEKSIQKLGPPAWPRSVHAKLLDALRYASAVGFDYTFAAPKDASEDAAFADAIARQGHVIMAAKFAFEKDENGEMVQVFEPPLMQLMQGAAGLGFVNTPSEEDQVIRRITAVDVNTFDFPVPCFNLAVALEASGKEQTDLKAAPGVVTAGGRGIPVDSMNRALINYWGPTATIPTIPYIDVLDGTVKPEFFKGKAVLIGATTQEEHDNFPTPFTTSNMVKTGSRETPGVEIHASAVQTYLQGAWFRETSKSVDYLALIILVLLTAWAVKGRSPWVGFGATLLALGSTVAAGYLAWSAHWWLSIAAPITGVLFTYVVVTASDFLQAEMARRKTKAMFSRYVSPDVVEELINNPDLVALGGRKQVLTIMFCDIRGFTAFSENKDPVDVIARLNEYLTAMTNLIFKNGGTLDKYLGDGLMAFFGAPVFYEDHMQRAIKTAIEIQEEVAQLNKQWAEKGGVPLLVACGINTGPAVVGNVGSPERMDYTLIGEDVNLASRVEALSKLFQTLITISERTYDALPEGEPLKDRLFRAGEELVKGFTKPIGVYTIKDMDLHFEKSKDKGFK